MPLASSSVLQSSRGSPKHSMGNYSHPQPPGVNKDKEYLKISEGLKTCCSNCRRGREGHALNELWICAVLQHRSHPSLHGVCRLRLPVLGSTRLGRARGCCCCCASASCWKGVKALWAESTRLMSRFNDVPRPCGKASCCPAKQLKLSCKIISERESWLNII